MVIVSRIGLKEQKIKSINKTCCTIVSKQLDGNYVLFILIDLNFIILPILLLLDINKKDKGTARYMIKCILCSCTCTKLKRCTCLNILELNQISSCWEWGEPSQKTYITWIINVRWGITPVLTHLQSNVWGCLLLTQGWTWFSRSFLTMEWYLMDSADNCVLSHVNHLEWRDDCLTVYVSLIKTNKKGVGQITPWHVHYNSNYSEIFPVNSLVMYLFNIYRSLWGIGYCLLVWTSIKDTLRL